tara:strand:+ start:21419 stop:21817 length:399 start_codon:yes stop_codon:yes gene_type:complete
MRYRLRTLLALLAVIALLLAAIPPIYRWYNSIPLSSVVAAFNGSHHEHAITEAEITAAIKSQLPTLRAPASVRATLRQIAKSRRVPLSTTINRFRDTPSAATGEYYWVTSLDFMTGPKSGFAIRVRETRSND